MGVPVLECSPPLHPTATPSFQVRGSVYAAGHQTHYCHRIPPLQQRDGGESASPAEGCAVGWVAGQNPEHLLKVLLGLRRIAAFHWQRWCWERRWCYLASWRSPRSRCHCQGRAGCVYSPHPHKAPIPSSSLSRTVAAPAAVPGVVHQE
jgi:hypothetical protein